MCEKDAITFVPSLIVDLRELIDVAVRSREREARAAGIGLHERVVGPVRRRQFRQIRRNPPPESDSVESVESVGVEDLRDEPSVEMDEEVF
jgi:hypothetical protein